MLAAGVVTRSLSDEDLAFALSVPSLVAFVVAAIMAGLLPAILPAARAARLDVLDALHYE